MFELSKNSINPIFKYNNKQRESQTLTIYIHTHQKRDTQYLEKDLLINLQVDKGMMSRSDVTMISQAMTDDKCMISKTPVTVHNLRIV